MELLQPWPEPYQINARSPYGPRRHPITGKQTFHHGIDVAMPVGTPLTAAADGEIVHKGNNGSGGVTLIIRHANNFHTVYYHLRSPSSRSLGERVSAGDKVAYSGNTGASTGPHLHFELRRSRKWGDTLDPVPHFAKPKPPKPVTLTVTPETEPSTPGRPAPAQTKPSYNRPLTADHMARLAKRFGNFGRRGWFGG
jgi:murein DD-endopeptidase MepM/ murein hydrolase activator NlpD